MTTIAVTGASGFVGSALVRAQRALGNEVLRVVRGSRTAEDEAAWDPPTGEIDRDRFAQVDTVVHLAGANVAAGRWTSRRRRAIGDSRGPTTLRLCRALAGLPTPPTFICASAIGIYGDRGDEELTELSAPGGGFLADVAREWEAAAQPLADAGARVAHLRIGLVLGDGGALAKMSRPFRLGLGGRLGNGRQYVSWIALEDLTAIVQFLIERDDARGVFNCTAPEPVTNARFTTALGRLLRRPTVLPAPALALRLLLGAMADELLLASQRVRPARLLEHGFEFRLPDLDNALAAAWPDRLTGPNRGK